MRWCAVHSGPPDPACPGHPRRPAVMSGRGVHGDDGHVAVKTLTAALVPKV